MSQATVTGKVGPGSTLTAGVFTNVVDVDFKLSQQLLTLTQSVPNRILDIDISAATTITMTVSSGVYTVTVS